MVVTNTEKIKSEFLRITGINPIHETNHLEDREIQKDNIFHLLAERVFDHPRLLNALDMKIKKWLSIEKNEFTYILAGIIYYLKDNFSKASIYFLRAVNENSENLDNWFFWAFSLYHQNLQKHNLGKFILFYFEDIIRYYRIKKEKISLKKLEYLQGRLQSFKRYNAYFLKNQRTK